MPASPISPRTVTSNEPVTSTATRSGARSPQPKQPAPDAVARTPRATNSELREFARTCGTTAAQPDRGRREALVNALLAHVPSADRPSAKTAIPAILDAARKTGSSDPNQIAYLLATAQTESDFGAHMTETGHSKQWFNANYGNDDGNRPGTGDGFAYRGRGYVQITHAGRYAEMSRALGLPDVPAADHGSVGTERLGRAKMEPALVAHPDALLNPKLAAEALVVGVKGNLFTHNAQAAIDKTIPVGKQAGQADFYHARAIVNGIVKDQAQSIAAHATTYAHILAGYRHSVLGVPQAK